MQQQKQQQQQKKNKNKVAFTDKKQPFPKKNLHKLNRGPQQFVSVELSVRKEITVIKVPLFLNQKYKP